MRTKSLSMWLLVVVFSLVHANDSVFAQSNCKLDISNVNDFQAFGTLVYYSADFKNLSDKTIERFEFTAVFKDQHGTELKRTSEVYNETGGSKPIAQGFTKTLRKTVNIKGAKTVDIKIDKIIFYDGSFCP
ncbi:MAG: hypothetical protein ACKO5C_04115 [Ferruginibacter sp.]